MNIFDIGTAMATEFQEGDYVLFWSKHKPEMQFIGSVTIDDWGIEYIILPDLEVHSMRSLREAFHLRDFGGAGAACAINFTFEAKDDNGKVVVEKIDEKEYFYRKLRGDQ